MDTVWTSWTLDGIFNSPSTSTVFIRVYTYFEIRCKWRVCQCIPQLQTWMQPPIDIPIPRQTSSFHSLDSSVVVGSPLGESHVDDFASTTPVSSSRNTFRSRRRVPSASQPNQWPLELTCQCLLFGQLMEIEGHLPSSASSTSSGRTESDADISVREHISSSPGLSPRIRPSTSYDASFPAADFHNNSS
jgi:hypothetical protein